MISGTLVGNLVAVRSDYDDIMHPKSFFVKRGSQPMEGHRPKYLPDRPRLH